MVEVSEKILTRRAFAAAALAAGATMAVGAPEALAEPEGGDASGDMKTEPLDGSFSVNRHAAAEPEGPVADQYGFLVNAANCVDCGNCVKACRRINGLAEDVPNRRSVVRYTSPSGKEATVSLACMHCEKPACAEVCPAHAITKGAGGLVTVDKSRCIGCKYCYQACPFGVPSYTSEGMDKCDGCVGAGIPVPDEPNCVRACKYDALTYGPLSELVERAGADGERVASSTLPCYVLSWAPSEEGAAEPAPEAGADEGGASAAAESEKE